MTTQRRRGYRGRTPQRGAGAARRQQQGRSAFRLERWLPGAWGRRLRRRRRKAKRTSPVVRAVRYWAAMAGLWFVLACGLTLAYITVGLPDTGGLWRAAVGPSVVVVDASGKTLVTRGAVHGNDLTLAQMSPYLPLAVLAAEDRRFYAHGGIDFAGLARAALTNLRAGHVVQGGSTITQQLAKNVFLTPERTFKRKLQEAMLALFLEARYSKDEILTMYLNRVYLGAGTFGIEAASQRYFDKEPARLTLAESALIAGLLKAPTRYAPTNDPEAASQRTGLVLDLMVKSGFINEIQRVTAGKAEIRLARGAQSQGAQYFVDWVLEQLPALIGPIEGEIRVETTLHLPFQRAAEADLARHLAEKGAKLGVSQAALVSIDATGAVRAMLGGRDYAVSQFNRATQAQRQPGSAFKPFVYLTAIDRGLTPESPMLDAPVTLARWSPTNFSGDYLGTIPMETALALSINTVAVRLSEQVGLPAIIQTARRMGITSPLTPQPSLALGSSEVSLLELTGAYLPFATGGMRPRVHGIERVVRRDGHVLYQAPPSAGGRVIPEREAGAMNAMMRGVLQWGTGRGAQLPGRDAAGKTGTSQDYRDAWFIGYTADLVTGVWIGNDDGTRMKKVTGGGLPAQIWKSYMTRAAAAYPAKPLPDGGYHPAPPPDDVASGETPEEVPGETDTMARATLFERLTAILGGGAAETTPPESTPPSESAVSPLPLAPHTLGQIPLEDVPAAAGPRATP